MWAGGGMKGKRKGKGKGKGKDEEEIKKKKREKWGGGGIYIFPVAEGDTPKGKVPDREGTWVPVSSL